MDSGTIHTIVRNSWNFLRTRLQELHDRILQSDTTEKQWLSCDCSLGTLCVSAGLSKRGSSAATEKHNTGKSRIDGAMASSGSASSSRYFGVSKITRPVPSCLG